MHYQTALSQIMADQNISIRTLSKRTNFSERWLTFVLSNSDWNPWLDTLLKLSGGLKTNVLTIVEHAEGINRQEHCKKTEVDITPEQISYALKTIRFELGLSQTTLAKLTRFQLTAISLRENVRYQSYPAMSTLEVYCKAFGIRVSSFLRYASSLVLSAEEAIS